MINHGYGVNLYRVSEYSTDLPRWRNDERIRKWCRQNDVISMAHHKRWLLWQDTDPNTKMYEIHKVTSDTRLQHETIVGVCGLTSIDWFNCHAEFSLYIGPEHQRQGYARKALRTLLHQAFYGFGMANIYGECFEGNPAAKLFEQLGFKLEGTRRDFYFRNGQYIDAHLYSILSSDFGLERP